MVVCIDVGHTCVHSICMNLGTHACTRDGTVRKGDDREEGEAARGEEKGRAGKAHNADKAKHTERPT